VGSLKWFRCIFDVTCLSDPVGLLSEVKDGQLCVLNNLRLV
jgi:hypothetical protein